MVKALYPGTFDPVTNGHLDIIARAARLFEEVIVAVYDTPPKTLLFSTEERVAMMRTAVAEMPTVRVISFRGLVVDCARRMGTPVLVRGLRAGSDFEYEFEMALMNKKLAPEIEAVYLMSALEWQFLSASRVKEVASLGGDISSLVPPHVERALRERIAKRA
ncbi:MAG: pantetheine-phosphate adenylyltransferase [Dehalococcoidia bacterium]|nr:pantetheine-phosphate adenylyltransferase [Dehalococcoidia bacterium]MDW8119137.1 pantetheine-phosphate adenylyltransferase [Chloroflexota bacterium]